MELEKMIMLFITLALQLEDHGLRLQIVVLLIWLTQMDICMELEATLMLGELCQMVSGVSLLMERLLKGLLYMKISSMELEVTMLFIRLVLHLEAHGLRLQLHMLLIWE